VSLPKKVGMGKENNTTANMRYKKLP